MARKPREGGDRDPITIRAARIGGRYALAASIAGAVVAAAAAVGFGLLAVNGSSTARGTSAGASPFATSPTAIDRRYDGKDPAGKDGLASKCADPPSSQPLTQVHPPVIGPNGRVVGHVDLRTSPICPVIWARVYWLNGSYRMPHGWTLHIVMHRPADHKAIEYVAYDTSTYVYGNMLANGAWLRLFRRVFR